MDSLEKIWKTPLGQATLANAIMDGFAGKDVDPSADPKLLERAIEEHGDIPEEFWITKQGLFDTEDDKGFAGYLESLAETMYLNRDYVRITLQAIERMGGVTMLRHGAYTALVLITKNTAESIDLINRTCRAMIVIAPNYRDGYYDRPEVKAYLSNLIEESERELEEVIELQRQFESQLRVTAGEHYAVLSADALPAEHMLTPDKIAKGVFTGNLENSALGHELAHIRYTLDRIEQRAKLAYNRQIITPDADASAIYEALARTVTDLGLTMALREDFMKDVVSTHIDNFEHGDPDRASLPSRVYELYSPPLTQLQRRTSRTPETRLAVEAFFEEQRHKAQIEAGAREAKYVKAFGDSIIVREKDIDRIQVEPLAKGNDVKFIPIKEFLEIGGDISHNTSYTDNKVVVYRPKEMPSGDKETDSPTEITPIYEGVLNRAAVAEVLTTVMDQQGLSDRKAAELTGTNKNTIQNIRAGKARIDMGHEVLEKLGIVAEVSYRPK